LLFLLLLFELLSSTMLKTCPSFFVYAPLWHC